jgi:hypothetical protein
MLKVQLSTVLIKYFDNSVKVVKYLDEATFSHIFHLEMSELISCVEIHTCMHAFICLILCVTRSSVVSLQVINMWKYIQSTFVLVPFIQGIHIGIYVWTLIWCIYLMASSPYCTWKLINDNTQHPKLQQRNNIYLYSHKANVQQWYVYRDSTFVDQ